MIFHFQNPAAFQLLTLAVLLAALALWQLQRSKRVLGKIFGSDRLSFLAQSISWNRRKVKIVLQTLTLAIMVFCLARPQSGETTQKTKSEGVELMMVIDVSNSMLAEDVKPSRLGLVKNEMNRLLDSLGGDRVGLVAFAGSAILLSPLTPDKSALRMYIDGLSPRSVSTQGTEFRKALSEAESALKRGGLDKEESSVTKVILLISDGENHDQKVLEMASRIGTDGIRIYTMAVGSDKGAPIPMHDGHGESIGFKRTKDGQVIMTSSSPESMRKIAESGRGVFHQLEFGGEAVNAFIKELNQLQKALYEVNEVTNYREDYQLFLFIAVMMGLIELFLGDRKGSGRIWRGRFEVARQ